MSEIETQLANAIATEDLCRFLSACYYEPTQAFTEERLFESMTAAAQRLHPDLAALAQGLGAAFAAQDLQTLLVDYTRLFLGPVNPLAQPYASFWLTGEKTLMQDTTQAVLGLYAEGGFDIDDAFQELPDHVAVELEFLYLLNFRIREAAAAGAEEAAELTRLNALREQFLVQHLAAWIVPFTQAVQTGAECAFYRDVAALTALWVRLQHKAPNR
jgi:TorA maturation chaperone TorD